jgi:hypothetical protein
MMTLNAIVRQSSFYYVQWQVIRTFLSLGRGWICSFSLSSGAPLAGGAGLGFLSPTALIYPGFEEQVCQIFSNIYYIRLVG